MLHVNDFIEQALKEIQAAVYQFNEENDYARAYLPDSVTFEIMVDDEGIVGGNNKVTVTIPVTRYHPACKR